MNNTFQELYEKYYSDIYKYFCRKIGESDAEDLTQQTFVKLITWIGCIDKIRYPKSFIFKVAKSVLYDYLRMKKLMEYAVPFDELYDLPDNHDFTEDFVSIDLFKKLTEKEKEIVHLKVQGYNSSEIGVKLGISSSTVRTYLEKIRKKLRDS